MGMIDEITEKAAQKIADKANSGSAVAKEKQANIPDDPAKGKTPGSAPAVMNTLGLKESNVSPASIAAPAIETNPMPNTNPAGQALGLGETDVAPGGTPKVEQVPVPSAPVAPNPQTTQPGPPVVAQQAAVPEAPKSGPGEITTEVSAAAAQPGFWPQVMDAAQKSGKSILELIGDFAAGFAGRAETPTQIRLAREQQMRLQGNQIQAEKDLMSIKQGYDAKQAQLDRDFQAQWNQTKTDLDRQQLKQQYDIAKQNMQLEQIRIQNEYAIQSLMYRWNTAQKVAQVGGPQGLFGGQ